MHEIYTVISSVRCIGSCLGITNLPYRDSALPAYCSTCLLFHSVTVCMIGRHVVRMFSCWKALLPVLECALCSIRLTDV